MSKVWLKWQAGFVLSKVEIEIPVTVIFIPSTFNNFKLIQILNKALKTIALVSEVTAF